MSSIHVTIFASIAILTIGSGCSDPLVHLMQIDGSSPTQESAMKRHYDNVFWGTLIQDENSSLWLVDLHVIEGKPDTFEKYRLHGPPRYSMGHLENLTLFFEPGTQQLPLELVPGRRYFVCEAVVMGRNYEENWSPITWLIPLCVIDLDETKLEAETRAFFRQQAGRGVLQALSWREANQESLAKWAEQAQQKAIAGQLNIPDIIAAVGQPSYIRQIGRKDGVLETQFGYKLPTQKLSHRRLNEQRFEALKYPEVLVQAHGRQVTSVQVRERETAWGFQKP